MNGMCACNSLRFPFLPTVQMLRRRFSFISNFSIAADDNDDDHHHTTNHGASIHLPPNLQLRINRPLSPHRCGRYALGIHLLP